MECGDEMGVDFFPRVRKFLLFHAMRSASMQVGIRRV